MITTSKNRVMKQTLSTLYRSSISKEKGVKWPRGNQQQEANDKVKKSFQQCQWMTPGPGVWGTPGRQAVKGWRTD
jgi:hypothetical protein